MSRLPKPFRFPIPIDPFRLLLATVERWKFLTFLCLLFVAGGVYGGTRLFSDKYTVTFTMLKQQSPRMSSIGREMPLPSPYQPSDLKEQAIIVAATSEQVIEAANESLREAGFAEAGELEWRVAIEELRRSGLFQVKAFSNVSPEAARAIGRAWGDAITNYLQEQRQGTAADAAEHFSKRIAEHQVKMESLNAQLLRKAEEAGMFDEVSKMQALYLEEAELKAARAIAESDLEVKVGQGVAYQREVKGMSWMREEIRNKGAELEDLRNKVTARNPRYLQLKAEITALNRELEKVILNDQSNKNDSLISSTVYGDTRLTMLRLEEETSVLADRIIRYNDMIVTVQSEIGKLPARAIVIADSKAKWKEALETSAELEAHLKEAEFFQKEALSPLGYLVEPEEASVAFGSKYVKSVILGMLAGVAIVGLAILLISWRELRRRGLRTPLQAAITTGAFPLLQLPTMGSIDRTNRLRSFWLTTVASHMPQERNFLFVTADEPGYDYAFWNHAFDVLDWDMPKVVFVDVTSTPSELTYKGMPLPLLDLDQPARYQISSVFLQDYNCEQLYKLKNDLPADTAVVVRWGIAPSATLRQLFLGFDRYYVLGDAEKGFSWDAEARCRLFRELIGESSGMILEEGRKSSACRKMVNRLELNYLAKFQDESSPERNHAAAALPLHHPQPWLA